MKTVKKKTMDDMIRVTRKYWQTGDADYLSARNEKADALSVEAFESSSEHWIHFTDLINAAVGLDKNVTNQNIYAMFHLAGIEVTA